MRRAGTASAWVNSGAPPPASIPLAGANAGAWGASSSRVYEEPAPTFGGDDVRARAPSPRARAPSWAGGHQQWCARALGP